MFRTVVTLSLLFASTMALAGDPYLERPAARTRRWSTSRRRFSSTGRDDRDPAGAQEGRCRWLGQCAGQPVRPRGRRAFEGQTVAVLHFYTGEGFDFSLPKAALKEKGLLGLPLAEPGPVAEGAEGGLEEGQPAVDHQRQRPHLNDQHLEIIDDYFDAGHGVYIWGDNQPYYADANAVADKLFGGEMQGNLTGDQVIGPGLGRRLQQGQARPRPRHHHRARAPLRGHHHCHHPASQEAGAAGLRLGRQPGHRGLRPRRQAGRPRWRVHPALPEVGLGRHRPVREERRQLAGQLREARRRDPGEGPSLRRSTQYAVRSTRRAP